MTISPEKAEAKLLASLNGGMWDTWQDTVRKALPLFAKSPIYVEQGTQRAHRFEELGDEITDLSSGIDPIGRIRDAEFGGTIFETKRFGPVTRMWVDTRVEMEFLMRYLPLGLSSTNVIDIGAGYGRLAPALKQVARNVRLVDAVPVSTEIQYNYCSRFARGALVLTPAQLSASMTGRAVDLAINVHSWNECTIEQVTAWIELLVAHRVPYLFTVSHGSVFGPESTYYTYAADQTGGPPFRPGPSFRPVLERYFDLIVEKHIGLDRCPHALWKLKAPDDITPEPPKPVKTPATAKKRPIVWIATPRRELDPRLGKDMSPSLFESFAPHFKEPIRAIASAPNLPWEFHLVMIGGGGVARARNLITSSFLKSEAAFLLFQDYDLQPTPDDYVRVLAQMQRMESGVVGGGYTIRDENGHWVHNFPDLAGPDSTGLLRLLELGTGFKCYRKSDLLKIAERNPWLEYTDDDKKDQQWGFFSMGPVKDPQYWQGSRWLTEDYWLDWLTRDAGIPVYWDTNVKIRHYDELTNTVCPKEFPPLPPVIPKEQLAELNKK